MRRRTRWLELTLVVAAACLWAWLAVPPAPPPPVASSIPPAVQRMLPTAPPDMIAGQVVSGLTGRPLKAATIQGWGPLRHTDRQGRFSFEAYQAASLLVDAPYHDHCKVTLEPGRFQEIRLMPASPID